MSKPTGSESLIRDLSDILAAAKQVLTPKEYLSLVQFVTVYIEQIHTLASKLVTLSQIGSDVTNKEEAEAVFNAIKSTVLAELNNMDNRADEIIPLGLRNACVLERQQLLDVVVKGIRNGDGDWKSTKEAFDRVGFVP